MQLTLNAAEQVALVIAVVAAVRVRAPKIDGWWVIVVSFVASMLAASTQADWASLATVAAAAKSGVLVFLYAVGGVSIAQSTGKKLIEALSSRSSTQASQTIPAGSETTAKE